METEFNIKTGEISFSKYVGGYRMGGNSGYTQFNLNEKPKWIHRYFMKLLLGFQWFDKTI